MSTPKISVHVMVCNSARYLAPCLQSLRRQTYSDFEVLMVDAGSTDASPGICAEIARHDPRFRYLRFEDRIFIGKARAEALAQSRGEYVAVLDSDDQALLNRLMLQSTWLDQHPETVLLGSYYRVIDESDFFVRLWPIHFQHDIEIRWRITFGNCLTQSTIMFRRAAANAGGGYDASIEAAEDIDFYGKLLQQGPCHILKTQSEDTHAAFPTLVQNNIRRQLGKTVDRKVAAAVYNQWTTPAESSATAEQSLTLLQDAHAQFRRDVAHTPIDQRRLARTVFLHLLQWMTTNDRMPWWPSIEPQWRQLVRATAQGASGYDWRLDPELFFYLKNILKTSPRALLLAMS
jgi:hypothetical protein